MQGHVVASGLLGLQQGDGHAQIGVEPACGGLGVIGIVCIGFLVDRPARFLAEVEEQGEEALFFHLAQQAVEVEVVELQKHVGGDKRWEGVVVVALVDVEQLVVLRGHDGKAVAAQLSCQLCRHAVHLPCVQHVAHRHAVALGSLEVQLQQFGLACLHAVHEGLLVGFQLQHVVLDVQIVFVAP